MRFSIFLVAIMISFVSCDEVTSQKTVQESQRTTQEIITVVDIPTFEKGVSAPNAQLIDVRTDREWEAGHLRGAKHFEINNPSWQSQIETLDKKAPVYVYCAKGGRSARYAKQLKEAGFTEIYDLKGGITDWEKAGKPVE